MNENGAWTRQGKAFWRAHHKAWKRSDLNQREYCEVHGLPQKAFENWHQMFRAELQLPERKLLYRQGRLSHRLARLAEHVFASQTLFADDTPIPVLGPGRGAPGPAGSGSYARDDRPWFLAARRELAADGRDDRPRWKR